MHATTQSRCCRMAIAIACCLVLSAVQVAANVVFQFNLINATAPNPTLSLRTTGFFQMKPHATQSTGLLLTWPMEAGCEFARMLPSLVERVQATNATARHESTGIILSWKHAADSGCFTYAELARAAVQFQSSLPSNTLPPIRIIFLILPEHFNAGPLDPPYNAGSAAILDGAPAIDLAFLSLSDGQRYLHAINTPALESVTYNARYEPGPWNEELFSAGYIALCWLLFAATILVMAYTLLRLVCVWRVQPGALRLGSRLYIYVLGLANAILYAVAQTVYGESFLHSTINRTVWILSSLTFLLMLLLWASRLAHIHPGRTVLLLKIQVYVSMLVCLVNVIFWVMLDVENRTYSLEYREGMLSASILVIPVIEVVVSLTFALFAAKFAHGWYRFHMARNKFMELFAFSLVGCFSFLFASLRNVIYRRTSASDPSPQQVGLLHGSEQMIVFIRVAVVLCVLGVRPPKRRPSGSSWDVESCEEQQQQQQPGEQACRSVDTKHSNAGLHVQQLMNDKHPMQSVGTYESHLLPTTAHSSSVDDATLCEQQEQAANTSKSRTSLTSSILCCPCWRQSGQVEQDHADHFVGVTSTELLDYQHAKQRMMKPSQSMHEVSRAMVESTHPPSQGSADAAKVSMDDNAAATDDEPFFGQPSYALQRIVEQPHLEETATAKEAKETALTTGETRMLRATLRFSKFPASTPVAGVVVNSHGTPIASACADALSPTSPDRATRATRQSQLSRGSSITSREHFQAHPDRYI
ncbi:hypothetical protein SYNPS1DRAFT_27984 [Syncephalis pseudoplumigaleata]|uniref:Lung seven transmembrane receptor-domain-containing protein n=1 Tax=Syncephalis pseudoplumigaleata TaxID=1712513 RepID=A0A4P9Z3E7_9FUNG|nr:hypothetical protein SYNPS1DRAFT_27984 [Syncephalis pseudoplumigaleata]|eukprot:RKP26321.1 hypothetical protein SYNPS1DRAFT_27984 [Syncephalis pseudoplumigaleata]